MNNFNVIIVHGAFGYPEENWFGWLSRQLNASGVDCCVPSLPTPGGQVLSTWLDTFNRVVKHRINQQSILIGHSLGAAFLFRWLEQFEGKVAGLFSIGAFIGSVGNPKFDSINASFFTSAFNWKLISDRIVCGPSAVKNIFTYYGTHDPYVPVEMFELIAERLQATRIIVSQAGHFNAASGYREFHLLLNHLQRIMRVS